MWFICGVRLAQTRITSWKIEACEEHITRVQNNTTLYSLLTYYALPFDCEFVSGGLCIRYSFSMSGCNQQFELTAALTS
jgi:hypothetical protein